MTELWSRIVEVGKVPSMNADQLVRLRLLNVVVVITMLIFVIYSLSAAILQIWEVLAGASIGFGVYVVNLWLIWRRPHFASIFFLLTCNLYFACLGIYFGPESGLQNAMFVLVILPFMFLNKRAVIYSFSFLSLVLFLGLHFWSNHHAPLTDFRSEVFYLGNMASVFVALFVYLFYFKDQYFRLRRVTEQQNEQLLQKNAELDRFAYVTAHDLKSPLRGIRNLLRFMEEDYPELVEGGPQPMFERLKGQAENLEALIDGILAYSRFDRMAEQERMVPLSEALDGIRDMFPQKPGIHIQLPDDMPEVLFQPVKLRQVFINLIGNAVRHHHQEEGQVAVHVAHRGEETQICVEDDGPGIPSEHHERVFEFFQTLKPKSEAATAGVGLTIVRKTVEERGGRIWLESEVGKGSRFCFTIPDQLP